MKLRLDRHDDPTRGCAIVEVALCNDRIAPRSIPTSDWLFQTALSVTNTDEPDTAVFLPVNDPLKDSWREDEPELRMLQMQYRHHLEFAIGRLLRRLDRGVRCPARHQRAHHLAPRYMETPRCRRSPSTPCST